MKLRRLLFAALLAVCFDVAVPLEPSAQGTLVWEDDEEEAVRAQKRRPPAGAEQTAPVPGRPAAVAHARAAARRHPARARRRRVRRVVHVAATPPHPAPTEDH